VEHLLNHLSKNTIYNIMINTLCLSGGGIKGISYIGTLMYLEYENYLDINNITIYVGTSSGSILSFFFNIGYSLKELENFVLQFDFSKLEPDINCNTFLSKYGMDDGTKIMTTIQTFLIEKLKVKDITFQELHKITNKTLKIFTTNFTLAQSEIFSHENTPNVSVLTAIRMSISVPFLFTPVEYNGNIYVDGGITYNFGLNYCDSLTTLGLAITNKKINQIDSLHSYLIGLCNIALDSISLNSVCQESKHLPYNYIEINCQLKEGLDFVINKGCVEQLISDGTHFARKYYSNFIAKQILDEIINKTIENNN